MLKPNGGYKSRQELEDEDWERYRKKQNDIYERKKAKFDAEGFKCKQEGCKESFRDITEWYAHTNMHMEDLKTRMICNQPKCGRKFNNRKEYNEHCEDHKKELKAKIVNSIRSVLMYNKHGLLLDAFESEYRGMVGRPIPHKFFGFDSLYDLLVSWPEVVQLTKITGGKILLIAVPDEKTGHMAKMVSNQRDNTEGYNRMTNNIVSRCGTKTIKQIEQLSFKKLRIVPDFLINQIEQILDMEAFETGIYVSDIRRVYSQEFGYQLEVSDYGFRNLEDFCHNGLRDRFALALEGLIWKVVPVGKPYCEGQHEPCIPDIPFAVKENVRLIVKFYPAGLSEASFCQEYDSRFGAFNLRYVNCRSLRELLILLPDCCSIQSSFGGDMWIFPPYQFGNSITEGAKANTLIYVKNQMALLLKGQENGVALESLVKGYEGYHGCLPLESLNCKSAFDLLNLMPDICYMKLTEAGQIVYFGVSLSDQDGLKSSNVRSIDSSLTEILKCIEARLIDKGSFYFLRLKDIPEAMLRIWGANLDWQKFGQHTILSLLEFSSEKLKLVVDSDISINIDNIVPVFRESCFISRQVTPDWVDILSVSGRSFTCLPDHHKNDLYELEMAISELYSSQDQSLDLDLSSISTGLAVAAISSDMKWHRGIIKRYKVLSDLVDVEFVDWGKRAWVKRDKVKILDSRFDSPRYSIVVRTTHLSQNVGDKYRETVVSGLGVGRISLSSSGSLLMDLFKRTN